MVAVATVAAATAAASPAAAASMAVSACLLHLPLRLVLSLNWIFTLHTCMYVLLEEKVDTIVEVPISSRYLVLNNLNIFSPGQLNGSPSSLLNATPLTAWRGHLCRRGGVSKLVGLLALNDSDELSSWVIARASYIYEYTAKLAIHTQLARRLFIPFTTQLELEKMKERKTLKIATTLL